MPNHANTLSRRNFLKLGAAATAATALAGFSSYAYGFNIEPFWFEVTHISLALRRLAPAFDGYRIAQLSDIHADEWMTRERLRHVVELVNQEQPNAVVLTGDFVSYAPDLFAPTLIEALRELTTPDGVYAVLGNHDHWTDATVVRGILNEAHVVDVSNSVQPLRRDNASLYICGVDDYWEEQARLDSVLDLLPDEGAALLLAHEPDFADVSAASGRFDLQLSGHTHGGQVNIPFIGPPRLPYLGKKYPSGLYDVNGMFQYTNRGVGMVPPYVRFNCRPEISIFTLTSAS
ncbi:MAG: metallophosphoesterase [Burkholderiales bacterium]|nr:metallophosphoesterase [Anaerolineae bacterium]